MSLISVSNLSYRFADGSVLFSDLSFSLAAGVTALIGNNGVGKSILADILTRARKPSFGSCLLDESVGYFRQIIDAEDIAEQTLADALQVTPILASLERIDSGEYDAADIDTVGDQWHLKQELEESLLGFGIVADLSEPCSILSGGQLARLQLFVLFKQNHKLLILDEPSNHLDREAKVWLRQKIAAYKHSILLITHDQELLQDISQFLLLNSKGITSFTGSYTQLLEREEQRKESLSRELNNAVRQQKHITKTKQQSIEKAQKRQKQGQALRRSGSQAKTLLDMSKMSAEKSMSQRSTQFGKMSQLAEEKVNQIKDQQEILQPVTLEFSDAAETPSIQLYDVVLPFGAQQPINMTLNRGEKLSLQGNNGAGKSTLLKVIARQLDAASGEISCGGTPFYIDQYFSVLDVASSMLNNVLSACPHITENKARALLASIGFRGDSVNKDVDRLSGGEKMRVTLLIASHQPGNILLLLDEPDNHLDLMTKQKLAEAIRNYKGGVILVSHSEFFTESAGVTKSFYLK